MKRYLPLLIVIVVGLLIFGGGFAYYRAKMQATATTSAPAATPKVVDELANEAAHARGPANAPVTLEIYGDFECPPCATTSAAIDEVEKDYASRLRIIYREFPLPIHRHAIPAALAAEAAGAQSRFWEMHDLLYKNQSAWSEEQFPEQSFTRYAQSLGLDPAKFSADSQSAALRARIVAEGNAALTRDVRVTPTIFVNGTRVHAPFTVGSLRAAVEAALKG